MRLTESEYAYLLARSGQPMPANVQEAQWQAQVVRLARELGLVVHHHYDARKSSPGWPDLAIVDPRPLGWTGPPGEGGPIGERHRMPYVYLVELKTARGKLTREQDLWLRALHGKTVCAEVWRPSQLQEILAKLRGA